MGSRPAKLRIELKEASRRMTNTNKYSNRKKDGGGGKVLTGGLLLFGTSDRHAKKTGTSTGYSIIACILHV